jgi:hypothetical protein
MRISPRFLLLAMLMLLPASASADCCVCSANGTNCSACCYPDQRPHCTTFIIGTAPPHCSCYCETIGGEGGGTGGETGCSVSESRTSVMGVDRADRGAKTAEHQLLYGLSRSEKRRDGVYVFEEWAVISSEGALVRASDLKFATRVNEDGFRFRPRGKRGSNATSLVIEEADHPQNSREIPLPSVGPIDIDADYPAGLSGQEIWFRAEVGKDEVVDQVLLLNVPDDLVAGRFATELHLLNGEIGKAVRLRYADEGRHRVVVFGLLRANMEGHLVMVSSRVILPKCCCNGSRCV